MRNKIVVGPAEYEAIFARCAKVGQTLTTRPPDVSSVRAGIAAALNELVEVGVDDGDGVLKGNYDHGGTFVCDRAPKGIPAIFWTCSYCDFHIALLPGGEPGGACPRCAGRLCWAPKPPGWRPPAPDTTGRIARDRHRRSGWFKPGWKYARVVDSQVYPGKVPDWIVFDEADKIPEAFGPEGAVYSFSPGVVGFYCLAGGAPAAPIPPYKLVREKCTSSQDGGAPAATSPSASSKSQVTPENSSSSAATSQGHASSKGKSAKGRRKKVRHPIKPTPSEILRAKKTKGRKR